MTEIKKRPGTFSIRRGELNKVPEPIESPNSAEVGKHYAVKSLLLNPSATSTDIGGLMRCRWPRRRGEGWRFVNVDGQSQVGRYYPRRSERMLRFLSPMEFPPAKINLMKKFHY